jgi:ComF family protein
MKRVLPQLAKFTGMALNILFPQKCLGCGEEGELICPTCRRSLPAIIPPICPQCGRPQSSSIMCPSCVAGRYAIDGIRSPLKFEGVAREAIHQFKYKNLRSLAGPLASVMGEYLVKYPLQVQLLVPVPLHAKRLKERGYNQSSLLAGELSKITGLPLANDLVVRIKYLGPQAKTRNAEERRQNVKTAFACGTSTLRGGDILLIDDVSTSGATLDACAAALKSAGANSVWGLVAAREL